MTDNEMLEVLLHAPGDTARKIVAEPTMTIGELLHDAGIAADLLVFEAEDDYDVNDNEVDATPVARDRAVSTLTKGRVTAIHCHHCHHIRTAVNYQSRSIERKFAPSTRVRRVLRWAKHKLHLKDADADNLALFLCNGGEQVRENMHLGELVTGSSCEVCFDLAKDQNIEGAG
jgi:hypothetical protein